MNVRIRELCTQTQFFSSAKHRTFEFDGFQPVAMTVGNAGHPVIGSNSQIRLTVFDRSPRTAVPSRKRAKPLADLREHLARNTAQPRCMDTARSPPRHRDAVGTMEVSPRALPVPKGR